MQNVADDVFSGRCLLILSSAQMNSNFLISKMALFTAISTKNALF